MWRKDWPVPSTWKASLEHLEQLSRSASKYTLTLNFFLLLFLSQAERLFMLFVKGKTNTQVEIFTNISIRVLY